MTLEEITARLTQIGFNAKTKVLFQKESVDVEVKDILALRHPEMVMFPSPFLRIKIYSPGNAEYIQFDCQIESFELFDNSQL